MSGECGNGAAELSVKSLASLPKSKVVIKVMAIPVMVVYDNYCSLTNSGYPQIILEKSMWSLERKVVYFYLQ